MDDGNSVVDRNDPTAMSVGLKPIPRGVYTVAWKNVSTVDGHLVRGAFLFSVGQPIEDGSAVEEESLPFQSPAHLIVRWLMFLGVLSLVGGLTFDLLVMGPVMLARDADGPLRELGGRARSRSGRLTWLAMGVFLAASVAQLMAQAATTYEVSMVETLTGPVGAMVTETEWGRLWALRLGLALAMALALGAAYPWGRRRARDEAGPRREAARLAALALGIAVLWTISLTSHGAATAGIRAEALLVDFLHLAAAALWVGALFHLAVVIPTVLGAPSLRAACLAAIVPRFSVVAGLSVATLMATGVFSAWAQVTVAPALATPYGMALLAKMALVAPLLLLGGLNLAWVRPRLSHDHGAGRWLRRLVSGEVALAVLVLASVAVLTSLEPARQVAAREGRGVPDSLRFQDSAEGTTVALEVRPGRVGPNDLSVTLTDRLGDPIDDATEVSLRVVYLDADLGETAATAAHTGGGVYVLEGARLSIAGPWQVEVETRRHDAFDARTAFRFKAPAGAGSASIVPSPETANVLLSVCLAVLGVVFMATGLALGGWYTRAGAGVLAPGVAGFLAGAALLVVGQLGGAAVPDRNPFPPTPGSLEAGHAVYEQLCQTCHGVSGRGDGPAGLLLDSPPADLAVHVPLHPEREIFRFIHDGISWHGHDPPGRPPHRRGDMARRQLPQDLRVTLAS